MDEVEVHLYQYGFVEDYYVWKYHSEKEFIRHRCLVRDVAGPSNVNQVGIESESTNQTSYHTMVQEAAGPDFIHEPIEEEPNAEAQNFYNMIRAADKPIYEGNSNHSQLSNAVRMLEIKYIHKCS